MNVSPEILRLLGASDEEIAAKEAEISEIKWVPPTETGLEHSSAIADSSAVALGEGGAGAGSVARVYKTVGAYDADASAGQDSNALKIHVRDGPEPVPKELQSRLPRRSSGGESSDDGYSESEGSWDEVSVASGQPWWEERQEDEVRLFVDH